MLLFFAPILNKLQPISVGVWAVEHEGARHTNAHEQEVSKWKVSFGGSFVFRFFHGFHLDEVFGLGLDFKIEL